MRCSRCHWPTSLWKRDLFSGRCGRCRWVDAAMPGLEPRLAARRAVCGHAAACLLRGEAPELVQRRVVDTGLDAKAAAAIVSDLLARQATYALAARLLDGGSPLGETRRALMASGLSAEEAATVVSEVQDARSGEAPEKPGGISGGGSPGLVILGGTAILGRVPVALNRLPLLGHPIW